MPSWSHQTCQNEKAQFLLSKFQSTPSIIRHSYWVMQTRIFKTTSKLGKRGWDLGKLKCYQTLWRFSSSFLKLSSIYSKFLRSTQNFKNFHGTGREVGGGFKMGNTCTPVADSCWCMAKPIQYCKLISLQLK